MTLYVGEKFHEVIILKTRLSEERNREPCDQWRISIMRIGKLSEKKTKGTMLFAWTGDRVQMGRQVHLAVDYARENCNDHCCCKFRRLYKGEG